MSTTTSEGKGAKPKLNRHEEVLVELCKANIHVRILQDAIEDMADLFKDLAGDQSTETGWKTDEMLNVWERAKAALASPWAVDPKTEGRSCT